MKNVVSNTGEELQLDKGSVAAEMFGILKRKLKGFNDYLFVLYGNNGNGWKKNGQKVDFG